jgi:spore coat polysaccharide biosynthesis protein SpsF
MIANVFLQARFSSSRLPGKVVAEIMGVPMLKLQIERLKKCKLVNEILVLTSLDTSDDVIVELCEKNNIRYFRGSLSDVLSRYEMALKLYPCDHIVRITGDCPLLDWSVIDLVIKEHLYNDADYTSNVLPETYPDGLDVEVMKAECLLDIAKNASRSYEREHVTYYCYQHPEKYKIYNVTNPLGNESHYRWTVDQPEDFEFVKEIYNELYKDKPFDVSEVRSLITLKPELLEINKLISRNEGLAKSLVEEKNEI